ncbi:TRAF3-interacting protein 1-like isoform X4 [Sapajus apella]|uniref:TRAF3-interacting protein 1 n=1 Tax=Sapajus apella TaxID=9515 RepID=A0A6J3HF87_SAPAP|nr:TRAF3-interacting protein 1-like isoform X4 [Sapajus apella]XP_032128577.1 TRAF3-interacting protein 1-like isoform X4 [Sapajus apella]
MTGFMKGLYTDTEMKSDNVKDKDAKISFLQKAIDVVVMVSGEPLLAKPARIVAGHEPERTNELLQIIGKCCLNKLSSDDAVRRVLAGEKGEVKGRASLAPRSQELDNKNVQEEESRLHKDTEGRRDSEIKERSTSRDRKQKEELKEDSKLREKDKGKEKAKENGGDRHREGERERARARARPESERQKDRGNRERDRDPEREKETERKSEKGKEKERLRDRDREHDWDKGKDRDRRRVKNGEHSRDPDREKNREHDKPEKKSASSGEMSKKLSDGSFKDSKAETETEISTRASKSLTTKTSKRRSKNSVEDDKSASLWRENIEPDPAVKQKGDSASDAEGDAGPAGQDKTEVSEIPEIPNELSSSIRKIPRPGSARPAPPRVKRQDSAEVLPLER